MLATRWGRCATDAPIASPPFVTATAANATAETVAATETTTEYRFARSSRVIARGGRARGRVLTITPKIGDCNRGW